MDSQKILSVLLEWFGRERPYDFGVPYFDANIFGPTEAVIDGPL